MANSLHIKGLYEFRRWMVIWGTATASGTWHVTIPLKEISTPRKKISTPRKKISRGVATFRVNFFRVPKKFRFRHYISHIS